MGDNETKLRRKKRRGRPPKSGVDSPICRQEFLEEYPEIRRDIQAARDGLIVDQLEKCGGDTEADLPMAVRLDIDSQVSKLALSKQIQIYIRRNGILRRDRLKGRKILEPEPILIYWLQLQNSLDRGLISLGLGRHQIEPGQDITAIIAEIDREAAEAQGQAKEMGEGEIIEPGASGCDGQGKDDDSGTETPREATGEGGGDE